MIGSNSTRQPLTLSEKAIGGSIESPMPKLRGRVPWRLLLSSNRKRQRKPGKNEIGICRGLRKYQQKGGSMV